MDKEQDSKVERFIQMQYQLTDFANLSDDALFLVKHLHPELQEEFLFVLSWVEPSKTFLPDNVVWLCFDPDSPYFKQAMRRVSYSPDSIHEHSWEIVYLWEDLWQSQIFDIADFPDLNINVPGPATTTEHGLVLLKDSEDESRVVVTTDERLSDKRYPTNHSHDEVPATILAEDYPINSATDGYVGKALVFDGTSLSWGTLHESMVDLNE